MTDYTWVYNVIDSCQHGFHFEAADKIIELYVQKYPTETENITLLQKLRAEKWNDIHLILIPNTTPHLNK